MERIFFAIGSAAGFLGVGFGAFGAHALKTRFEAHPELGAVYQTAVHYHLVHALALLATAWAAGRWDGGWATAAGWAHLAGIVLFSGSLYVMALTGLRWLGAVTPLGGLCFLAGWAFLALAAWRA